MPSVLSRMTGTLLRSLIVGAVVALLQTGATYGGRAAGAARSVGAHNTLTPYSTF